MRNVGKTPTPIDILEIISDPLSMDIINAISSEVTSSDNLMKFLDMSPKKYYSRYSRLMNVGLIGRREGKIVLSSFGWVVYKTQLTIANAFLHSQELRIIDAVKHAGLSDVEQKLVIDKIFDDTELKNLVVEVLTPDS